MPGSQSENTDTCKRMRQNKSLPRNKAINRTRPRDNLDASTMRIHCQKTALKELLKEVLQEKGR